MKLSFWGAARVVTGSCHRLTACSKNILNNKPASARSTYKAKVLNVAVRMANEALEVTKGVSRAAAELETLHHGTAS